MLSEEQSEVVVDTLLSPSREAQAADSMRADELHRKRVTRQRVGEFGLTGFVIGAACGYLLLGNALPAAFAGLGIGFVVGQILGRRAV